MFSPGGASAIDDPDACTVGGADLPAAAPAVAARSAAGWREKGTGGGCASTWRRVEGRTRTAAPCAPGMSRTLRLLGDANVGRGLPECAAFGTAASAPG